MSRLRLLVVVVPSAAALLILFDACRVPEASSSGRPAAAGPERSAHGTDGGPNALPMAQGNTHAAGAPTRPTVGASPVGRAHALAAMMTETEQDPAPSPAADLESGREVLDRHCGTCHRPELPTSKPAALAVFSLADPDWSARMSDEQLCSAAKRIRGSRRVEPGHATIFAGVVDRLLAGRRSAPCPDLADPDSGADLPPR